MTDNIAETPTESVMCAHTPIQNAPTSKRVAPLLMSLDDPENPQTWPVIKKIYVSAVALAAAFAVAFCLTAYTVAIPLIVKTFDVTLTAAIGGFSIFLFGVVFSPILAPHYTEAVGRSNAYLILLPLFSLFTLGAGASRSYESLMVCRFFAGFFGGPCFVLIEGTYADVWSPNATAAYYGILTLGSFIGAACGPLVLGFIIPHTSWRWTQWVPLMVTFVVFFFALGMPQTDSRAVMRRRARYEGLPANLAAPATGVGLREKTTITFFRPFKMMFTQPLIASICFYLAFCFAVLFASFVFVPSVLMLTYKFTPQQIGLAFITAIAGSVLSALTTIIIDRAVYWKVGPLRTTVEHRFLPGMLGGPLIVASLWWIANTASPTVAPRIPVAGTGVFVWGVMSVLTSLVSYLFDAFPPRQALGALAAAGVARLSFAGALPLVIIQMITNLGGKWALQVFAIIAIPLMFIPYLGFAFGHKLRRASRYNNPAVTGEKSTV